MTTESTDQTTRRKPVPRGIATSGPALWSYGFRPYFILAGCFAPLAMVLWIGALTLGWDIGGSYGALNWHAHEMLFGYATAALAGFMLTAIPNWTGRLPVSGRPLMLIVGLWMAGRVVMLVPDLLGVGISMSLEALFLPTLAVIAGREIVSGKNWKNLKILGALIALTAANVGFHLSVALSGDAVAASRAGVAIYVVLVAIVGGRIVPSFTRNWLAKAGVTSLPVRFGRFDLVALLALGAALLCWIVLPEHLVTAAAAIVAAVLHGWRLARWRGLRTLEEPLLFGLHVAYAFVPLGCAAVALAALGWLAPPSALHLLTVGVIGGMTLAVMTRVSRGHTGRPLTASLPTSLSYLLMLVAAVVRPFAELIPASYHALLGTSGACWILAFGLFLAEYGPILLTRGVTRVKATPPGP